jgi:hypothetical protein
MLCPSHMNMRCPIRLSYEYVDIVQDVVNRGIDVNTIGDNGKLPLHLAWTKQLLFYI